MQKVIYSSSSPLSKKISFTCLSSLSNNPPNKKILLAPKKFQQKILSFSLYKAMSHFLDRSGVVLDSEVKYGKVEE